MLYRPGLPLPVLGLPHGLPSPDSRLDVCHLLTRPIIVTPNFLVAFWLGTSCETHVSGSREFWMRYTCFKSCSFSTARPFVFTIMETVEDVWFMQCRQKEDHLEEGLVYFVQIRELTLLFVLFLNLSLTKYCRYRDFHWRYCILLVNA